MLFNRSLIAGILISIGAMAYLSIGGFMGAVAFSVGLTGVIILGVELFTGRMVLEPDVGKLGLIWLGNFMGCAIGSLLSSPWDGIGLASSAIIEGKVATGALCIFISATLCGFMMACATVPHALRWGDRIGRWLLTIACVVGFIMIGADHCVADTFYWFRSGCMLGSVWIPLVATLGNYAGGWLFKLGVYEKIG